MAFFLFTFSLVEKIAVFHKSESKNINKNWHMIHLTMTITYEFKKSNNFIKIKL